MALTGKTLKRTLIPLAAVPVILVLAYGFTRDPREIPSPLVGKPAPLFQLKLFDGTTFDLEKERGKVVVVNFWVSWCIPACVNEAPRWGEAWKRYKDRGVVILGVNFQDKEEDARAFMKRFNKVYPNGPDVDGKLTLDYGVYGVPETFFVDQQGIIAHKHIGEIQMKTITEQIERLLGD